jgi:Rrf2 family nitric oxide-sensitive transcriptional repressor
MRLTVYADYSLRLLMYLALKEDGSATISEVAKAYGISKSHLMKVAHQLGVAGYIGTVRGKGGGLRLGKPAQEIGLGEVVRYAEPDMALVPCFAPVNAFCPIVPSCILRRALEEAREAFLGVLDGYTLADLVQPGSALRALLSMAPRELDPCRDSREPSRPQRVRTRARSEGG